MLSVGIPGSLLTSLRQFSLALEPFAIVCKQHGPGMTVIWVASTWTAYLTRTAALEPAMGHGFHSRLSLQFVTWSLQCIRSLLSLHFSSNMVLGEENSKKKNKRLSMEDSSVSALPISVAQAQYMF